ncbi:iron chelate uptake ABC transporter family permease subunit [Haladaptatus sp. F3-133]|jgi:iron complex transport system permease protein|uniref:Cobalamin import system permease protein BtuC n=1 Tax=Halorutilus salinus TaxID=2487751 RepID=A0A9Q4GJJ1_9EURY|nr:iron chelate uptake ABC transporter family permease subunit [Halorutilus salinus]MCX2819276.1 iron chelate uptake ABC transporter family permease subunit [Halorutilus salinus]
MAGHETTVGYAKASVRSRTFLWCASLSVALVASVVTASTVGAVDISYASVASIVADAVVNAVPYLSSDLYTGPEAHRTIIMNVRLPRVVVGAVVGFALSAAGAVMQGFFRNPMADPSIVGVSSGAAVGAVAVIVFALPVGVGTAAFVGALATAATVYSIATKNGRTGVATLLLAGVAVQTFLSAVVSYMMYISDDQSLRSAVYWMMGNMLYKGWSDVVALVPPVAVGFVVLVYYARDLNVLLLGEEEARTLGVEPRRTKLVLLAVSSLVTAAAVSVAGVIGFVGLVVPHAVRLVVGPDHRILVPTSSLAGGIFLVSADAIARSTVTGGELPVGIVTALVGVPFFLYLLRDRKVHEL